MSVKKPSDKRKKMFSLKNYLQANATRKLDKEDYRKEKRHAKLEAEGKPHQHDQK